MKAPSTKPVQIEPELVTCHVISFQWNENNKLIVQRIFGCISEMIFVCELHFKKVIQ